MESIPLRLGRQVVQPAEKANTPTKNLIDASVVLPVSSVVPLLKSAKTASRVSLVEARRQSAKTVTRAITLAPTIRPSAQLALRAPSPVRIKVRVRAVRPAALPSLLAPPVPPVWPESTHPPTRASASFVPLASLLAPPLALVLIAPPEPSPAPPVQKTAVTIARQESSPQVVEVLTATSAPVANTLLPRACPLA